MRAYKKIIPTLLIATLSLLTQSVGADFDFDYFGAELPGLEAKRFNPQISSLEGRELDTIHFTPDGNECYFVMIANNVREVFLREKRDQA